MLFNSWTFVVFFLIVYPLYLALRDYKKQNAMLLLASYVFYGWWDWRFLSLLFLSTTVDYVAGLAMAKATTEARRKLILGISLCVNFGILGIFKYYDFFMESLRAALASVGVDAHIPTLGLILPVGVSFYTFHSVSYTVDIYRRESPPATSFIEFALYVSYFPQLVAGPIAQASQLLPQVERARAITADGIRVGIWRIMLGYFKKVVLADTLAPLVDYAFGHADHVSGVTSLAGVIAFSVQIYGDFAGYTLIARGLADLMGFSLIENFHMPYLATDPRDFWKRWHIGLSAWLRTYLYITLGGNRRGKARTYLNLMITMMLGGLWHGANWTFLIWGTYHGVLLVLTHRFDPGGIPKDAGALHRAARIAVTYVLVLFSWLIFRVQSVGQMRAILVNIFTNFHWGLETPYFLLPAVTMLALLTAYHLWQERNGDVLVLLRAAPTWRFAATVFLVVSTLIVGSRRAPFIYFQF